MSSGYKTKPRRLSHTHKRSSRKHGDILADVNKRLKAGRPVAMGHAGHHNMPFESIRYVEYNDHHITIRTQYQIKVDGKSLNGHIYVDNTGRVSTHAMPNYSFTSTVAEVR